MTSMTRSISGLQGLRRPRVLGILATAVLLMGVTYLGAGTHPATPSRPSAVDATTIRTPNGAGVEPAPGSIPQIDSSIKVWAANLAAEPRDFMSATSLARLYYSRGRLSGDLADQQRALEFARTAARIAPTESGGQAMQAAILYTLHDFSGALAAADALFRADPSQRNVLKTVAASLRRGKRGGRERYVRIPRLAILDLLELRRHGVCVVLPERERRILDRLSRLEAIPRKPVPEKLRTDLRLYQAEGFDWLAFLYENRFGACLADDMGLGKTVQAIAFLAAIKEGIVTSRAPGLASLIVMPPSLLFNWESELDRFYPGLKLVVYRGKGRTPEFGDADLVLTTYDIVRRDIDILSVMNFDVVVFDEAQSVKNLFAKSTGAARRLRCAFAMALTGTPVENHLGEYYSILDLVVPGIFGDYEDVRRKIRKDDPAFLDTVRSRSRPFVMRRAKETILPDLPPKVESDIFLELTDRQKTLYRRAAESAREEVERAYRTRTEGRARIIALTAILRLRQLCLSPELLLPAKRETAPKIEFLLSRLEELREEGHSVLVFSQFTSYLDLVERAMRDHGMGALRLDGATPVPERKRRVESFQGGEDPSVFLLSMKAGGKKTAIGTTYARSTAAPSKSVQIAATSDACSAKLTTFSIAMRRRRAAPYVRASVADAFM